MNIVERVPAILLRPKETWPRIAAEPATPASIYGSYLVFLAAIPAICGFIGWTLIGGGMMGVSYKMSIGAGLVQMVVGYLLSLGLVWVLALIVNALAPTFGGRKDFVSALKGRRLRQHRRLRRWRLQSAACPRLARAARRALLDLPPLHRLAGADAQRGREGRRVHRGRRRLLVRRDDRSRERFGALRRLSDGRRNALRGRRNAAGRRRGLGADQDARRRDGDDQPWSDGRHGQADGRSGSRVEQGQKSGDGASASLGAVLGAVTGAGNVQAIAPADLKAMLPESIGDLKRTAIEAQGGEAMGIAGSGAKASYAAGDARAELAIADTAGLAGIATMAAWANMTVDKETDGKVEKVYKDGARTVHEEYRKDGSHAERAVILANGVVVTAEGDKVDIATLKRMIESVDLAKLETTKRVAKR
jgi:hypothetical protein